MKIKLILLILAILLISVIAIPLFIRDFLLSDYNELDVRVNVGDHIGFNVNTDAVNFGTMLKGTSGTRWISIQNNSCNKCKVIIKSYGKIARWISIQENNFYIKEGDFKQVPIMLDIPLNAKEGNYTSKLGFYFWKTI